MIPQTIIEAIAAHNKKGNADAIDTENYAVKALPFSVPYLDLVSAPYPSTVDALNGFVSSFLTPVAAEMKEMGEPLGYSLLVGETEKHGAVITLHIFIGRPLTPEQKEIRKAISELSEADKMEYNAMLTALRKVMSPAAFDAYRKALSMAGVTRNQWNQEINKGRIPRYTGPADGSVIFYPGTRFSEPEKKS